MLKYSALLLLEQYNYCLFFGNYIVPFTKIHKTTVQVNPNFIAAINLYTVSCTIPFANSASLGRIYHGPCEV